MFDNERSSNMNGSLNWPENNWVHSQEWNDPEDKRQQISELKESDELFKFISDYTHLTSYNISYTSILLEVARAKKAYE